MTRIRRSLVLAVLLTGSVSGVRAQNEAETQRASEVRCIAGSLYRLRFADAFRTLDSAKWLHRYSWGRENPGARDASYYVEPSFKTVSAVPALSASSQGLRIAAEPASRTELPSKRAQFTSGIVNSLPFLNQRYGYWEARIAVPTLRGTWPAFWMQTRDGSRGEIDIMEILGNTPGRVYQTLWAPDGTKQSSTYLLDGPPGAYHTYAVAWTADSITFFVDGRDTATFANPINTEMHLMLNLQVGAPDSWPGAPDRDVRWPAVMRVAYVRVYSLAGAAERACSH